jgi:hypothetical protein
VPQNYWAVICPEPKAPGIWGTWVKEDCVAIGWPPPRYPLYGPPRKASWEKARVRALEIQPGDIIIPYLMEHRFGIPGIVTRVAIKDSEWNPTVPTGGYSRAPDEPGLGRRIEVEWLRKGVPPFGKIAVMPKNMQKPRGAVRATIEPVRPDRYVQFMKIISDQKNWKVYENSGVAGEKPIVAGDGRLKPTAGGTLSRAASFLAGQELYLERARRAFPLLVRQALARQTIFYSNLSEELKMTNPRNLNYVLGAIGRAIQELAAEWKQKIPPLQCIVVNKNTGMPGEGIGWFISDLEDFGKRTADERKQILGIELVKVFNYAKWEDVLSVFGLTPLSTDPVVAALKAKARRMGGIGEQQDHKDLKHYIANNPGVLGLPEFDAGDTEYCFPSADRMDVVFHNGNDKCWVGVEVKGLCSDDADILRGLFQCVKYAALREAELKSDSKHGSARVVLVLSRKLPSHLIEAKNLLGIEVIDEVAVPENSLLV